MLRLLIALAYCAGSEYPPSIYGEIKMGFKFRGSLSFLGSAILSLFVVTPVVSFALSVEGDVSHQTSVVNFTKVQKEKVITLRVEQLEVIANQSFADVTVYAMKQDKLVPIPFQFEEYSDLGFLFQGMADGVDPADVGVFNKDDLLVFMLGDSGVEAGDKNKGDLDIISKIQINDYEATSYIYLVRNGERSKKSYVSYDLESGVIDARSAQIHMNPKDLLDWGDVLPVGYSNKEAPSILDSIKIRIRGTFMNIPLKLDNDNLEAKLKHVYAGPVRMTLDAEFRAVILRIPVIKAHAQVHMDVHSANLYVNMSTPKSYSKYLKDPYIIVAIDGNALYGGFVKTSVSGDEFFMVDGLMEEKEEALSGIPIDEDVSWIWLSSKEDFNIIGQFDVLAQDVLIDEEAYTDISVYYRDDKTLEDKPERFAGALPSLGYRINGMPENESTAISYKILFIENMNSLGAGEYLKQLDSKPEIIM